MGRGCGVRISITFGGLKISKNTSAAEGHFGGFESDRRTLSSATAVTDPLWKKNFQPN